MLAAERKGPSSAASDLDTPTQLTGSATDRRLDPPVASFRADKIKADGHEHRIGVYWKAADKQDEARVGVPAATLPNREEPPVNETTFYWWYGAIAGAVGVLLCVL